MVYWDCSHKTYRKTRKPKRIKTITNLKITTFTNLFDQNDKAEYLTIDYIDEDGNQKQIKKLPHEEDAGRYNVKNDSWEDILEDWRLTKPDFGSSADVEGWELLENYLQYLTGAQSQELEDQQNKLYEADKVADILRNISRLSDVGRATLNELLVNGSENVRDTYMKHWNLIESHHSGDTENSGEQPKCRP